MDRSFLGDQYTKRPTATATMAARSSQIFILFMYSLLSFTLPRDLALQKQKSVKERKLK